MEKLEIIKKCDTCGKEQEGKIEGNFTVYKGSDCECGGTFIIDFK